MNKKITRYKRNGFMLSLEKIDFVKTKFVSKSVVDNSQFRPNMNELSYSNLNGSNNQLLYDFPDGVDTGLRVPILRDVGSDISEINEEKKRLENVVDAQKQVIIDKTIENTEKIKKEYEKVNSVKNVQNNNTNNTTN